MDFLSVTLLTEKPNCMKHVFQSNLKAKCAIRALNLSNALEDSDDEVGCSHLSSY
jgi:hypothetical protein